jgi:hypothetical protein
MLAHGTIWRMRRRELDQMIARRALWQAAALHLTLARIRREWSGAAPPRIRIAWRALSE